LKISIGQHAIQDEREQVEEEINIVFQNGNDIWFFRHFVH